MKINASKINKNYDFIVNRVSSIVDPLDNSIMFCNEKYFELYSEKLLNVKECIVFLPKTCKKLNDEKNLYIYVDNPRLSFAKFINNNIGGIKSFTSSKASIGKNVVFGENCTIEDFAYINGNVKIGNNCVIKSGVKIYGDVIINDNCIIENNVVIGSTALAYEFDKLENNYCFVPQIGGVKIGNNVTIGPNTTIARGAIKNTIIKDGCKIDANCYVSHNCILGENILMVGHCLLMGSVNVGNNSYISGNVTIRDNITIGKNVFVAMGAVVTHNIEDNKKIRGIPAKEY